MNHDEVKALVRDHIAREILGGEDPENLTDDAKLVSEGIVDSLSNLRLVSWLEERFGVRIEAHEMDVEHLDTLDAIAAMIIAKQKTG